MGLIATLQEEHRLWVNHNFPKQLPYEPLLGIVEEVGELSHAHLKYQQGIRGINYPQYVESAGDALGDLFIYMMSYCNASGLSLEEIIETTWEQVGKRDWKLFPENGVTR